MLARESRLGTIGTEAQHVPQAMFPASMKASPPNILRSVTASSAAMISRTRWARFSSYAIVSVAESTRGLTSLASRSGRHDGNLNSVDSPLQAEPRRCAETAAKPWQRGRLGRARRDAWVSSNSAVSAVFTDTLASMSKHSCSAFADLGLTPDTSPRAWAATIERTRSRFSDTAYSSSPTALRASAELVYGCHLMMLPCSTLSTYAAS
jgi:hypothetical protein